jgi:hypothetical protein
LLTKRDIRLSSCSTHAAQEVLLFFRKPTAVLEETSYLVMFVGEVAIDYLDLRI